jgi:hypothetical protein
MPNILVNGDSFSYERHFAIDESYVEKTWAHAIGANNIALGGCSNDRIFYSTIEYLNKNLVDFLIIGWTSFERYSLPLNKGLNLHLLPSGAADDNLFGFNEQDKNSYMSYHSFYYKNCHNIFLNFQKFLNYYLHLQDYCNIKKIKFLNFLSLDVFPYRSKDVKNIAKDAYMDRSSKEIEQAGIIYNTNLLTNLIKKINTKNWIQNTVGFSYAKLVKDKGLPLWKDGHPGLEASKYWGELIQQHIVKY